MLSVYPTFSVHGSRPERRATGHGVTRLGFVGVFLYLDLALSIHCGFFRASMRLARSLMEYPKLTRWSVDELFLLYVQEDHQSTSCLSALTRVDTVTRSSRKGLLLATVRFRYAV